MKKDGKNKKITDQQNQKNELVKTRTKAKNQKPKIEPKIELQPPDLKIPVSQTVSPLKDLSKEKASKKSLGLKKQSTSAIKSKSELKEPTKLNTTRAITTSQNKVNKSGLKTSPVRSSINNPPKL